MVKGFLKSTEGIFQLSPGVTVIGRENCDLVIESPTVEVQHAIVEYSDSESCFVLQDLNTAHGTYVNDCRVQNAAVRLAPGDIVRFSYSGVPMELDVEDAPQVTYPPVQQRPAWSAPLQVINTHIPISGPTQQQQQQQLPHLASVTDSAYPAGGSGNPSQLPLISAAPPASTLPQSAWATPSVATPSTTANVVVPRPPRPRPSSAGTRRGSGGSPVIGGSPTNSPLPPRRVTSGWVSTAGARTVVTSQQGPGSPVTRASPVNEMLALHEKEQRLLRMGDEINRLAVFEAESLRKDGVIAQLRDEMEAMASELRQRSRAAVTTGGRDTDSHAAALQTRVKELEADIHGKQLEINALKEQMTKMRPESSDPMDNVAHLRSTLLQKEREQTSLKQEMERVKKEKATANGLVTTLQRDMANRDNTICRMRGELEIVKRELREKEVSLSAMTAKFSRFRENKKHEEEMAVRNKELMSLKHKLRSSETRVGELTHEVESYKQDIEKLKKHIEEEKEMEEKYKSERDHAKVQFAEMQRLEKTAKADVEQSQKRLERFRTRIMQTTFSAPGFKMPDPDTEISDDTIVETMKKLIEDRTDGKNKLRELKETNKSLEIFKKDSKTNSKTLKQQMVALEKRLQEGGRTCAHLLNEIKLLSSVTVDESLQGIKDTVAMMLQDELSWQQEYESTLEKCGIDTGTPGKGLAAFIDDLKSKKDSAQKVAASIQAKFDQLEKTLKSETGQEVSRLKTEYETKLADALEITRLEAEKKLQTSLEELRQEEAGKRENAVKAEQERVRQQEASLEELRQALTQKNSNEERLQTLQKQLQTKEKEFAVTEEKLKADLAMLRNKHQSEVGSLRDKMAASEDQHGKETAALWEQVKQHALTISSLEERVVRSGKDLATGQAKVLELQQKLAEQTKKAQEMMLKYQQQASKPELPPKPVIVQQPGADIQGMEQLIALLKKENANMKKELQDQQDVILGLRRDLAGAAARLSDMTGELNERQKEELEDSRLQVREQEAELTTQRQQLVKLSELVDKKTAETERLVKDLAAQKELVSKHKQDSLMKGDELAKLQVQLGHEQENSKRALEQVQQEGMITSEMSAIGAQCRGERHEQVIARQREALAELRSRIKGMESNRPPLPTQDQALQQVILLKKELAEMRAKQAQIMDQSQGAGANPEAVLEREVAKARGQISTASSDAAIERSARIEMQQGLEVSEQSYLKLAQSVANLLSLGEVAGQDTMGHLPRDERDRLADERSDTLELITSRLRTLNQRLERKDELLRDYEKDLEKLRLAERLANEKAAQVEALANDLRGRTEEAHYLRETLRRTREGLDQEKRLNRAIKSKKTFHLENDDKNNKQSWPKHNCYVDEGAKMKKDAKKKTQKEKILRKNYELESLKAELSEKDQQLCETTAKLINLEHAVAIS
ncbi:forkhead-associated domain-containing protein 1-like isoform X2 [Acanthaster planci]|uniref:Forkhead-associated domain-containing protein 1-like isoform X2 n=1 Tax=Acanthaster planci TaxID=133434 RepID=A0A8B7YD75_ACAPL|nr:forkhead-associated domain-containing protein 1-like isoform X2 [Acanthaster planci]